jgi:hypothetical protein
MKMVGIRGWLLLLGGIAFCTEKTWAGPPPRPNPKRVSALVRQLDDKRFAVRARADRQLRKYDMGVVPLLAKHLRKESSLEVCRRLRKIIFHLFCLYLRPLVPQLGDDEYVVRKRTSQELLRYGKVLVPFLKAEVTRTKDPAVQFGLKRVLQTLSR